MPGIQDWSSWSSCGIGGDDPAPATIKCLEVVFANLLVVFVSLAGLGLFIMIIVGAFQYLTAGDNAEQAQKARNSITYAILGLVLMILSWIILLAIEWFTGVPVTVFKIPDVTPIPTP
jgi:sterol desaturase/sphingolipid hydroxylase (fatty acid hydroxylase superfamily)